MKKKTPSTETKTYVLDMKNGGQKRVTVPATWKVTFGPLCPGSRGHHGNGESATCLRFYEGKDQQRAVFVGVSAFRDDSIAILERVTKVQQQNAYKDTPAGAKRFTVEARVSSWQDPDNPEEPEAEFLALPAEAND